MAEQSTPCRPPAVAPRPSAATRCSRRPRSCSPSRGFDGVSIEDLGSSVGRQRPRGLPALPQQAGRARGAAGRGERGPARGRPGASCPRPGTTRRPCAPLVRFHVDFALRDPDVIRVQDRDLAALSPQDRESVRDLQRRYVDLWVDVLARLSPSTDRAELRLRAQATFGLLNSTPHSARSVFAGPDARAAGGDGPGSTGWTCDQALSAADRPARRPWRGPPPPAASTRPSHECRPESSLQRCMAWSRRRDGAVVVGSARERAGRGRRDPAGRRRRVRGLRPRLEAIAYRSSAPPRRPRTPCRRRSCAGRPPTASRSRCRRRG